MARISGNIHVQAGDTIKAETGVDRQDIRWINLGGVAIFAPDAELVALRNAIDAYLAQSFAQAEAA